MDVCQNLQRRWNERKTGRGREEGAIDASGGRAGDETGFPQFCRIVRKAARIEPSWPECGLIDLSCFY